MAKAKCTWEHWTSALGPADALSDLGPVLRWHVPGWSRFSLMAGEGSSLQDSLLNLPGGILSMKFFSEDLSLLPTCFTLPSPFKPVCYTRLMPDVVEVGLFP